MTNMHESTTRIRVASFNIGDFSTASESANGGNFGTFGTIMRRGVPASPYPWDNIVVTPNIKILNSEPVYEPWMNDHAIPVADLEI